MEISLTSKTIKHQLNPIGPNMAANICARTLPTNQMSGVVSQIWRQRRIGGEAQAPVNILGERAGVSV